MSISETQDHLLKYRNSQSLGEDPLKDIWHTTYCGIPAIQAWQDFLLWERFLNQAQVWAASSLIEIGTFLGGFTLYLQHQAWSRGMTFYTIDFQRYADFENPDGPLCLNATSSFFHHMDVFTPQFEELLSGVMSQEERLVLFCDGGNKPKEMQTFSPRLRPGDLMATHDWGNEITDADLVGLPIEKVMQEECEKFKSLTRFFRRI